MFYVVPSTLRCSKAHCEVHLIVRVQTDINLEIPLVNLRKPLLDWLDLRDT